jgi:hypothetical protein
LGGDGDDDTMEDDEDENEVVEEVDYSVWINSSNKIL